MPFLTFDASQSLASVKANNYGSIKQFHFNVSEEINWSGNVPIITPWVPIVIQPQDSQSVGNMKTEDTFQTYLFTI